MILSASTLPDVYQGNKRYPGGTFTCPGKNRGLKLEIRRPFFIVTIKDGGLPMSGDRSSLLDEHGDLGAEPGSRPWAVAVRREIQSGLKNVKSKADYLESMVTKFEKHHGYKQLNDWDGNPFVSYEYFCLAKYPYGLGYSKNHIDQIVHERRSAQALAANPEVKELGEHRRPTKEEEENKGDNVTFTERGNSSSYLVRRLKRDAPEIAEGLANGEYPSARRAAIVAGIIRVPTPLEQIIKLWEKLNEEDKQAFFEFIDESE